MNALLPPLSEDVWHAIEASILVRPAAVAAGRARMAAGDWPAPLAVADAMLTQLPFLPNRVTRSS